MSKTSRSRLFERLEYLRTSFKVVAVRRLEKSDAGIVGEDSVPMEDVSFDSWRKVMTINLDGVFLGCQAAMRVMKSSKGGSIINNSSVMRIVGGAGAAYNASKGGVRLLSKSVAVYCGNNGYKVRCNSIHSGYLWIPMVEGIADFVPGADSEDSLKEMLVQNTQ